MFIKRKRKMGWKNWPCWLRGGLIAVGAWIFLCLMGLGLSTLDLVLTKCGGDICKGTFIGSLGLFFLTITIWALMLFGRLGYLYHSFYIIIGLILTALPYFIIGSLIGFLLKTKEEREKDLIKDKIKTRKKSKWWLKGGIIGLIIGIFLEFLFILSAGLCIFGTSNLCTFLGILAFLNPVFYIHKIPILYGRGIILSLRQIITSGVLFFLIGVLVTYIMHKIKPKNNY